MCGERLGVRKTSPMGTLDPAVSGVLPIAINRACRLSPYLMRKDKRYVGIMRLHEDVDGEKTKERDAKIRRKNYSIAACPLKREARGARKRNL